MTTKQVVLDTAEIEFADESGKKLFSDCITTLRNLLTDASKDGDDGYLPNIISLVKERYNAELSDDKAYRFSEVVVREWKEFKKKPDEESASATTSQ